MNIKNVIFFNSAARGDVFIGRGYIKKVIKDILEPNNINCKYVSCWNKYFTKDITPNHSRWNYLNGEENPQVNIDGQSKWFIENNNLYFNTWYCADFQKYHSKYDCSLQTMHCIFSEFYEIFNLKISDNIFEYLPVIDYSFYNIKNVDKHFNNKDKNRKNIFISTSVPRSGQAPLHSLLGIIKTISNNFKECDFYITDPVFKSNNVFYTGDIIHETDHAIISDGDLFNRHPSQPNKNNENNIDLIEASYFSTFSSVIVGKSTGTYTYSVCKENILNEKTKFMGICSLPLSSANLHTMIPNKFYSVYKHDNNLDEGENLKLLTQLIES